MPTKIDKINKKYQSLLNLIHFDLDPHLKDLQKFIESNYNVKVLYIVEKKATTNFKDSGSKNNIVIYLDSKASIEQIKKRYKFLGKTTFVNDELIDQTIITRYFDLLMNLFKQSKHMQ